jgi:hypothetical protein
LPRELELLLPLLEVLGLALDPPPREDDPFCNHHTVRASATAATVGEKWTSGVRTEEVLREVAEDASVPVPPDPP